MKYTYVKKSILMFGLIAFALLLAACNQTTQASQRTDGNSHNLIVSHFQPANQPVQSVTLEGLASDLYEQTDGRITMEFYPSNTLGDAGSQYDMAVTGEADIALSVFGYSPGRFPLMTIMEMPFLTESSEHASEILMNLYEEFPEMQEELSDTHPIFLYAGEPAQLVSKDIKINSPEDMRGLRVRSPSPIGNEILEALGATPISMPMGDVYESLERGVIDAAMVPYETLYAYSLFEVIDYITVGNFSSTPFFSVMNKETYNSFSEEDQQTLNELTGMKLSKQIGRIHDEDGRVGLEKALDRDVELIELEEDELAPWEEALKPMVESWIDQRTAEGFPAQEIYDRAMELKEELSNGKE